MLRSVNVDLGIGLISLELGLPFHVHEWKESIVGQFLQLF